MTTSLQLAPEVVAELDHTLEHFNANHADTVLLLARYAAGCTEAADAEAVAVDGGGVDFEVRIAGEPGTARMSFDGSVVTAADVQAQVVGLIGSARANAGEQVPVTSMEREMAMTGSLTTWHTHIAEIRDLTPNLREIVVEGGFDGFVSLGGDQFAYLFAAGPGGDLPDDYTMATFMQTAPDARPLGAYYTVREWDATRGRVVLWVVLHGQGDGIGGWAQTCQVGEHVALWGPREGFEAPADTRSHLLVADESGFAAVAARLDELAAGTKATVIVETIDAEHVIDFSTDAELRLTWLFRGDAEPGNGTAMLDAVRDLDLDVDGLAAFGGAESRQVTAIRKYLRRELGVPADQVSMTGYWRRASH